MDVSFCELNFFIKENDMARTSVSPTKEQCQINIEEKDIQ